MPALTLDQLAAGSKFYVAGLGESRSGTVVRHGPMGSEVKWAASKRTFEATVMDEQTGEVARKSVTISKTAQEIISGKTEVVVLPPERK